MFDWNIFCRTEVGTLNISSCTNELVREHFGFDFDFRLRLLEMKRIPFFCQIEFLLVFANSLTHSFESEEQSLRREDSIGGPS